MKNLLIAFCSSCSGFLFAKGGKILPGLNQSVASLMDSTDSEIALKLDEYLTAVEAMGFQEVCRE